MASLAAPTAPSADRDGPVRARTPELESFLAYAREHYEGGLPRYVEQELRAYLECGDFSRGFTRSRATPAATTCSSPSPATVAKHLPELRGQAHGKRGSVPGRLGPARTSGEAVRADAALRASQARRVQGRRAHRARAASSSTRLRDATARAPSATGSRCPVRLDHFVQRFGSLNLNVHFHSSVLDGVFGARRAGSAVVFHPRSRRPRADLDAIVARTREPLRGLAAPPRLPGRSPLEERARTSRPRQTALDACAAIAMGRGNVATLPRDGTDDADDEHRADEGAPTRPPSPSNATASTCTPACASRRATISVARDSQVRRSPAAVSRTAPPAARRARGVPPQVRRPRARQVPRHDARWSSWRGWRQSLPPTLSSGAIRGCARHRAAPGAARSCPSRASARDDVRPRHGPRVRASRDGRRRKESATRRHRRTDRTRERRAITPPRPPACPERQRRPATLDRASRYSRPLGAGSRRGHRARAEHHLRAPLGSVAGRRALRGDRSRVDWATLLRRSFAVDVLECPKCHGRLRVIAVITERDPVRRILAHLAYPPMPLRWREPGTRPTTRATRRRRRSSPSASRRLQRSRSPPHPAGGRAAPRAAGVGARLGTAQSGRPSVTSRPARYGKGPRGPLAGPSALPLPTRRKASPWPLKEELYVPDSCSLASLAVKISMVRSAARSSLGITGVRGLGGGTDLLTRASDNPRGLCIPEPARPAGGGGAGHPGAGYRRTSPWTPAARTVDASCPGHESAAIPARGNPARGARRPHLGVRVVPGLLAALRVSGASPRAKRPREVPRKVTGCASSTRPRPARRRRRVERSKRYPGSPRDRSGAELGPAGTVTAYEPRHERTASQSNPSPTRPRLSRGVLWGPVGGAGGAAGRACDAQLSVVVVTPAPQRVVTLEGARVDGAGGDLRPLVAAGGAAVGRHVRGQNLGRRRVSAPRHVPH